MASTKKTQFRDRLLEALADASIPNDRRLRGTVAKMLKVSPETIRKWLEEGGLPKLSRAQELAARLKVNVEWLLTGNGEKRSLPPSGGRSGSPPTDIAVARGKIVIPLLDARASMGHGNAQPEYDAVVDNLRLSESWCRKQLAVTNIGNLAALSAYGDSMRPTFDDGDILLVDCGITELKVDAVYVLQFRDELYVKRVQRRPDGTLAIKSDNSLYETFVIDPEKNGLRVLGRVVWAWNGRRL